MLHRSLYHPSSEKLLNLLKLSKPYQNHTDIRKVLEDICHKCDTFQRFSVTPGSFKVSLSNEEELVFKDKLSIDFNFLDNCSLFHVLDTGTRFSAATFQDKHDEIFGQSLEGIWQPLASCRFLIYTCYPNRITSDEGSTSKFIEVKSLVESKVISMWVSGIRVDSSLGIGK